jgi:hypothetical protein
MPDAATVEPQPESFPKLVAILETNDAFALGSACAALNQAGITFDTVLIPDVPEAVTENKPRWWTRPSRILVSNADEAEAREIVEPFLNPTVTDEAAEDAAGGRQGGSVDSFLNRLFLPHPTLVQKIGCSLLFAVPGVLGLALFVSTYQGRSTLGVFIALCLISAAVAGIVRSCK